MPKVTNVALWLWSSNETWNCFILQQMFLANILWHRERVKSSKRTGTQCGWHWIILLPEAADVLVEEGNGKDQTWSLAWHMWLLCDPIMGTSSQPKIRLPHPQDKLSLNPSPPRNVVQQSFCSDRMPYTWAVSGGSQWPHVLLSPWTLASVTEELNFLINFN